MKSEKLYEAFSQVKDEYIEEAQKAENRKMRPWVKWGVLAACICAAACLGVMLLPKTQQADPSETLHPPTVASQIEMQMPTQGKETQPDYEQPTEGVTVYISGLLPEITEDDLFSQSLLVVSGTVDGCSDGFQVRSSSGMTTNYTDFDFKVREVYRGDAAAEYVTVRLQGGTAGGRTEICTPNAEMESGKEYLLFLYQPGWGGGANTQGDYYYILGLTQGTFAVTEGDMFLSQTGQMLSRETLLERANEYPIDPLYFRNSYIANQKSNLETGFITQQEYEEFMALLDVYAQIVE